MPAEFVEVRDIPLADLTPFPGNARRGDVEAIRASLRASGQYRSLVVRQLDGGDLVILAGNHTAQALAAEGRGSARCEVIRCTDAEGRKINLADNKTSDLATDDPEDLAALLRGLDGDYAGTGWAEEDLTGLGEPEVTGRPRSGPGGDPPDDFPSYDDDIQTEYCCPRCSYEWSGKPK